MLKSECIKCYLYPPSQECSELLPPCVLAPDWHVTEASVKSLVTSHKTGHGKLCFIPCYSAWSKILHNLSKYNVVEIYGFHSICFDMTQVSRFGCVQHRSKNEVLYNNEIILKKGSTLVFKFKLMKSNLLCHCVFTIATWLKFFSAQLVLAQKKKMVIFHWATTSNACSWNLTQICKRHTQMMPF